MTALEKVMDIVVGSTFYHHYQTHHHVNAGNHCDPNSFNESMDVLRKTCFTNYDTLACIRSTALVFLTAVTGMLCATRVVSLHVTGHPNYYQYAIFYLAVIQCILGCVEWVLGWTVHATLACLYLRCLELVVICHFYLTLACRVTRRSNGLASRLSAAALSLFLTYFTSFMIIGFAFSGGTWCDCFANYWLFLSGGQFVLIQLFATAAFMIIHRVNAVRAQESFKKAQRRGVWILVFAFETSAIASIAYHITVWALATEEGGCSGVFLHKQWIYSPVRIAHEVLTSLLPLWAMLYVFKPLPRSSIDPEAGGEGSSVSSDRRQLINSGSQSDDTSMMDPSLVVSPSLIREWRRRRLQSQYLTAQNTRTLLPDALPARPRPSLPYGRSRRLRSFIHGRRLISSATEIGGMPRIRRCSSAPSTLRNKRTPPLATIPEEPIGNVNPSQATSSSGSPVPESPQQASSVDYVLEHHRRHFGGRLAYSGPASQVDPSSSD